MKAKKEMRITPQKAFVFSLLFTLLFTALSGAILRNWRSEERRVGKECRL